MDDCGDAIDFPRPHPTWYVSFRISSEHVVVVVVVVSVVEKPVSVFWMRMVVPVPGPVAVLPVNLAAMQPTVVAMATSVQDRWCCFYCWRSHCCCHPCKDSRYCQATMLFAATMVVYAVRRDGSRMSWDGQNRCLFVVCCVAVWLHNDKKWM